MNKIALTGLLLIFINALNAQYINEVIEYKPAPGQLINESPWGTPSAAESIIGGANGSLSLGAWGGYVIFTFNAPVENHPDNPFGVDFTIFGNPMPDWSEPGIVWVMKDENNNGQADDTWYQIAGSDYYFSNTIQNYEVTYTNPGGTTAANVPWEDNQNSTGKIYANATHTQTYYPLTDSFPGINSQEYTLSGTQIQPEVDSTSFQIKVYQRAFGYADNQQRGTAPWDLPDNPYTPEKENSGGDGIDINWAVDANGNYVELDQIDFVKVQNGMMAHASWLGEVSTEITGAIDVAPNPSVSGRAQTIAVKDLPPVIKSTPVQLEAKLFENGRPMAKQDITWQVNSGDATIDANELLHINSAGTVSITASMTGNSDISKTITATAETNGLSHKRRKINVTPNPADDYIQIEGFDTGTLEIYNTAGRRMYTAKIINNGSIDISRLRTGVYLLKVIHKKTIYTRKIIKK